MQEIPRRRATPGGIFVFVEAFVELAFEKQGGLIPAILQDNASKEVLMLGYVNPQALAEQALEEGRNQRARAAAEARAGGLRCGCAGAAG
jgi:hypothetical protein